MAKLSRSAEGWGAALLLAVMIMIMGAGVIATRWTDGLDIVLWAGLGGLAAGLLLGWSVFHGLFSHLLGLVYGVSWIGFLLGRTLPGDLAWGERILELVSHIGYWIQQAVSGGIGRDELIFVLLLGSLAWILGYNAAWNTFRRLRVWVAVIPLSIAALASVVFYIGPAPMVRYLVAYLFLALLFIGRSHVLEQEQRWRLERVAYNEELRASVFRASAIVAAIVLTLAWVVPTAAANARLTARWRQISGDPWETVKEEWQRLFSTLHGPQVASLVEPFGSSLTLGGPQTLKESLVMDVAAPPAGRYYWRGAVYDTYATDRWTATENERMLLIPRRQPPGMEQYEERRAITQTITSYRPGRSTLVAAAQWVTVNREAEAYIDLTGEAPLDFIRVLSVLPLDAGGQYSALSYVSEVSATSLRQASSDYPAWVLERYLQLPAALPTRVRQLAQEITGGAETPYDKALALEQYLRRTITYDLEPPELPSGRDYVEFLLFESQRDYCNGYATAMVVMARSVGIPARLAVGYGQGEYDFERGAFRVREKNAHSWPELYFPKYGWIEFEPTASELPFVRPEATEEISPTEEVPLGAGRDLSEQEGLTRGPESGFGAEWQIERLRSGTLQGIRVLAALLATTALAAAGWWALENWGLQGLSPIEREYARLLRFGRWLGHPLRTSDTPREWARGLSALSPEAHESIQRIVEIYLRFRFARGATSGPEAHSSWLLARPLLWRSWLRRLVPAWALRRLHGSG